MRYIEFEKVAETIESLCIAAGYELPDDVLVALEEAAQKESNPTAVRVLNQLIENARIAKAESIPLCQDTGLAVDFIECGSEAAIRPAPKKSRRRWMMQSTPGLRPVFKRGICEKALLLSP